MTKQPKRYLLRNRTAEALLYDGSRESAEDIIAWLGMDVMVPGLHVLTPLGWQEVKPYHYVVADDDGVLSVWDWFDFRGAYERVGGRR